MQHLLSILLPLMLMVLAGIITVRTGVLSAQLVPHVSQFLIRIALPCYLIYSLSITPLQDIWQANYFIGYSLVSLFLFLITYIFFKKRKNNISQAAIMGFGASMSNTGFIGTAVLTMLIGVQAIPYLAMTLIIENIVILTLMLACAERTQNSSTLKNIFQQTLSRLLRHPIIQAIVIGIVFSMIKIDWPHAIAMPLQLFAQTATPLALFVIGASLAHFKIQSLDAEILSLVTLKMVLMPVLMLMVFTVLPNISTEMRFAAMILAALPMASATAIYGQQYDYAEKAAVAVMLSTLVSIFTLGLVIHYLA